MKFTPCVFLALLPLVALSHEITVDNVQNLKRGLALASADAPSSLEEFESILRKWELSMASGTQMMIEEDEESIPQETDLGIEGRNLAFGTY